VVIPHGFMEGTRSLTQTPQLQVILDGGTSSIIAGRALGAAQGAVQSLAQGAVAEARVRPSGNILLHVEALFNRAMDFRMHSITAQLALITFQITTLVAVMGIVREREIGTIEMLTITPLRRLELIGGKAITPLIIGVIDFLVMFAVTQVVFRVPMRGSFVLLFGLTALYLFCEIGYALMLSTITRSQQQAVTMVFIWAMVGITLSGYLVPISRLPQGLQWVSWFVPLRHYLTIVRGVMLKGAGITALWREAVAIAALSMLIVFATTRTLSRVIE
jgi:ABC-2 type transport system permease protein